MVPFSLADFPYHTYERRGRIYEGKKAKNIIPYQVRIVVENSTNEKNWTCGGTIISSNHVLTARYCIENNALGSANVSDTYIEAGFSKLEGREACRSYQVHTYSVMFHRSNVYRLKPYLILF